MFQFTIDGDPKPQKQTKFIRATGIAYNPSSKDQSYIRWQIGPYLPSEPISMAVEMRITFYLPIPQSTPKRKRIQMLNGVILPTKKPDIDNLAYLVTNAFKGCVYHDDSQVVDMILRKRYSDKPRTVVEIIPIEEAQPFGGDPLCA